jgi:carboxymethylenebutenolidase
MTRVVIQTRDGQCPSYEFRPDGEGPFPAALVYMDGLGIRPTMLELGERLASYGYYVLLPDLFYRAGPYEPMDARVFTDPALRAQLRERFFKHVNLANAMSDTQAFLDHIAAQTDVKPGPIGVTGYCMGGEMSLAAAGTYPDRIAAAASYHGGRLATDAPGSPHLLAPKMRARIYVAGATDDASFPEDMKQLLIDALERAGVAHTVETYAAKHGWVFRDLPIFDAEAAERHWTTLVSLFDQTLKSIESIG